MDRERIEEKLRQIRVELSGLRYTGGAIGRIEFTREQLEKRVEELSDLLESDKQTDIEAWRQLSWALNHSHNHSEIADRNGVTTISVFDREDMQMVGEFDPDGKLLNLYVAY